MPSKKALSVLIFCVGVIVSVFLFSTKKEIPLVSNNDKKISLEPVIKIENTSGDDWKKSLLKFNENGSKTIDLTKNIEESDTTLTDQMSKDILSQYLLALKNNGSVNSQTAAQIAQNTLNLPEYNVKPLTYKESNLLINPKNDQETVKIYEQKINQALQPVYYSVKTNPLIIISDALNKDDQDELKKLDPIIKINRDLVKYLLTIEVPSGAVKLHLDLLNTSNSILSNLESLKVIVADPARGFPALAQYSIDFQRFSKILEEIEVYLLKKSLYNY